MKITKKELNQIIESKVNKVLAEKKPTKKCKMNESKSRLNEKFGDMATMTVGAERDGDKVNVQLQIHGKVIKSKSVPVNSQLYNDIYDLIVKKLK